MTNPDWKQFLNERGANWAEDKLHDFGNTTQELNATLERDIICDLSHFTLIKISGDDAQTFLQGQFSNDVKLLTETISHLSSYNTPKGRILACFRLYMIGSDYYMRLPSEIAERTVKRLRMFVMRSKVVLEDLSQTRILVGLSGPDAESLISDRVSKLPKDVDQVGTDNGLTVIRVPGIHPRYEISGDITAMQSVWGQLTEKAMPVGADAWALLDIHAGIPNIYSDTLEEFVPQMVNLHALNGVNFKKGCYTGQEIVARMHYLGKLKKRMFLIHVDGSTAPRPKDDLFEADSENTQSVGQIVDAVSSPKGGFDALAVIQINSAREKSLKCRDASVKVLELPYAVSNEA